MAATVELAQPLMVNTSSKAESLAGTQSPLRSTEIIRLPTEDDTEPLSSITTRSTFHIYQQKECHKTISPVTDPTKERRSGPTYKETKLKLADRKQRKKSGLPPVDPDDNAFYLHSPYLAFHLPPRILYAGSGKQAKPAVLIHESCCWKEYKLQLGPSIAKPGVIDARGVVSWKQNGGDKKALKENPKNLKGYKVRTWRLWGETGKKYVHSVKENRKSGTGVDPDVLEGAGIESERPIEADEVVFLRWKNPLSRHTRTYHFEYAGIVFHWKGTGTVKESRTCGLFLRYNHLKLVAKIPGDKDEKGGQPEVCLGKFTSSIASKKSGSLDFFDTAILRLIEEHAPHLLATDPFEDQSSVQEEGVAEKISRMKKSTLYQVIVATGMCMILSEKEKRQTFVEFLAQGGEAGGGAGG